MTSQFRRRFASLARLIVVAGTSYFLVATSYEPTQPPMPNAPKPCYHATETLTFQVTGTCGPEGSITVTSPKDECAVAVTGASAVGLPSAGRFNTPDEVVSLARSPWDLSGYLPESQVPVGPQADAGIFTVVGRDAQARDPSGSPAVTGQHATPLVRTCSYQAAPSTSVPSILKCSGGGAPDCQAVLQLL
jgi:hypothetical protein